MAEKRVVITGMGLVSPVGNTVNESWKNIKAGNSGIDWITLFDSDLVANRVAGEVKNLDLEAKFGKREMRRMEFTLSVEDDGWMSFRNFAASSSLMGIIAHAKSAAHVILLLLVLLYRKCSMIFVRLAYLTPQA